MSASELRCSETVCSFLCLPQSCAVQRPYAASCVCLRAALFRDRMQLPVSASELLCSEIVCSFPCLPQSSSVLRPYAASCAYVRAALFRHRMQLPVPTSELHCSETVCSFLCLHQSFTINNACLKNKLMKNAVLSFYVNFTTVRVCGIFYYVKCFLCFSHW